LGVLLLVVSAGAVFAEAQVQMADPPSTVEQTVSAQPAPAGSEAAAPPVTAEGVQKHADFVCTGLQVRSFRSMTQTGNGKIFVSSLEQISRIRTGETGESAI
jgi:hypothetical protein